MLDKEILLEVEKVSNSKFKLAIIQESIKNQLLNNEITEQIKSFGIDDPKIIVKKIKKEFLKEKEKNL